MIFNPVSYLNRAWHYLAGGSWRKTLAWFAMRGDASYAHIMHSMASRLTATQIRDLAAYYAALCEDAEKN